MEYISAEEFLKQPEEVKKVFIDWWQCEIGDLFAFDGDDDRDLNILQVVGSENQITMTKVNKGNSRIPLLSEGQLRGYIQDSFNGNVKVELEWSNDGYIVNVVSSINDEKVYEQYYTFESEAIKAYWYAALEIAKED